MTERDTSQGAEFRTSRLLEEAGFRHAFFTRRGGVSKGPYASLNFSLGVGDEPSSVAENIRRAARALGVAEERVYFLSQVHGAVTRVVSGTEPREAVVREEGDAVVGRNPEAAVGVRIADCVPVLVGDRTSGAVVAIHAGWKGLVGGVIEAGVRELRRVTGGDGRLVAAIGPHITVKAFEVSEDVATRLADCSRAERVVERHHGPKPHVSLAAIARAQLVAIGMDESSIDVVPGCTFDDADEYFSYRRDGARSGRHLAAIVPRR